MTTKFPQDADNGDGSWFLEAVGATPPRPTGADAMAELTRENEVVSTRDDSADEAPADTTEPAGEPPADTTPTESPADTIESGKPDRADRPTVTMRTTQITMSSFDGNPGTVNATYDRSRRATIRPAATLPPPPVPSTATAPPSPTTPPPPIPVTAAPTFEAPPVDPDEVDASLARPLRSKRSFRWPIVVVLVLAIAAVAAAVIWLPQATSAEALRVRQSYYDRTSAVRNHLPAAQTALDAITDLDSSADALSASIPIIATLDSLAFDMEAVAIEPLPSVLPLVPKGAIDALKPVQQQTTLLGAEGAKVASRLGYGYIYRTTIPNLLNTGNLPTSASTDTINTISVTLSTSLSQDATAVAALPADGTFADVRQQALDAQTRYAQWQTEYLSALTSQNTELALTLVRELDDLRAELNTANAAALGVLRTELDTEIVTYASQLESHMTVLTQL